MILYTMKILVALLSMQAVLLTGTPNSGDIHLLGVKEEFGLFNLTCFSCRKPYDESVDFHINEVQVDTVRYSDGKCYHKRKICNSKECTCSMEGNNFTLSIKSDLSFMDFSCEMRFRDEDTSKLTIQTAHLIFNETEFIPKVERSKIISLNEDKYLTIGTTDVKETDAGDCNKNDKTSTIVGWTMVSILALGFPVLACICTKTRCKKYYRLLCCNRKPKDEPDKELHQRGHGSYRVVTKEPDGNDQEKTNICRIPKQLSQRISLKERKKDGSFSQIVCDNCAEIPVCTVCINCRKIYCKVCCDFHTESEKDHQILHIPHAAGNQEIICGICNKKTAQQLCTVCLNLLCESCAERQVHRRCKGTEMMKIYHGRQKLLRLKAKEKLQYFQDLSIEKKEERYPIRICGISYIADGRLILVDKRNRNLFVFKSKEEEENKLYLEEEPHAVTSMTGQHIAITFPFEMEIRIYKISKNSIDKLSIISLPALGLYNLKPYSIAFDNDFFAVEVGEGDDGMIIVMNDTQIHKKILNTNLGYFTGHTIRLAVEVKSSSRLEGRIFISALSKNMVSCVDLQGNEIWKVSIPSPRGISVVPEDCIPRNSLVICSRRCNAIFGLNKENGSDKQILLSEDKIKLPRFITCNSKDRLLCIQVATKDNEEKSVSCVEVRAPPIIQPS